MPTTGRSLLRRTLQNLAIAAACPAAAAAQPTQTAEYSVTFDATWSALTHPSEYPSGPHFSGLIGATHDGSVSFWDVCQLASPGIENMSELGSKSPLSTEIQDAIAAGDADSLISGGGINPSPGSVSVSFQIDVDFPLVTLVSMIAPSPDWFVGVSGLSLLQGGDWVDDLTVALLPYDAGTDSGVSYASANQDTDPQELIMSITTLPVGNGVPLGTFIFTRVDAPTANGSPPGTAQLPERNRLYPNAPNPFNPSTTVRLDLARPDHVSLRIFDVGGRLVRTLVDARLPRQRHAFAWDGVDERGVRVPSGTYFYQLRTSSFVQTRKMIVMK